MEVLNESFQRRAEFDLIDFWCGWVNAVKNGGRSFEVVVAVNTRYWRNVLFHLRYAYHQVSGDESADWRIVTLRFDSIHEARSQLIQLGGCVRVISPEPLRLTIMDYAEQIGIVYQSPAESDIGRGSI